MSSLIERYRSFLRPGRKNSDMFLLACLVTLLLMLGGTLLGLIILRLWGMPPMVDEADLTRIALGQASVQEVTGAPAYLSCASMYLAFYGMWIVFALAMAIPIANRKMLDKLLLVFDKRSLILTALGALAGFGINTFCVIASIFTGDVSLHFEHFEVGPLLLLLFAVFVQSGAEELTCRLFLYQKLARRYRSPAVPIIVSAVFFAVLHGMNPGVTVIGIVQILVIGILFAVLVCYYDAFGACVAMHTMWNFAQNIVYGLPNSGAVSLYSIFKLDAASDGFFFNVSFGVEGSIGAVVLLSLACVGLIVYAKKRNLKPYDLWADNPGA